MKKVIAPLLVFLFSQIPSIAQLQLIIDTTTHQIDWLTGFSITRQPGQFDNNTFGQILITPGARIDSPLLTYSGDGVHNSVSFEFSQDRTSIVSIGLGTTAPPGGSAIFSGTAGGPAIPTFSLGDWSQFSSLNNGDYTLNPTFGPGIWNGGIHVTVVPEPATYLFWSIGLSSIVIWRTRRSHVCR